MSTTVNITPTWAGILPLILAVLEDGNDKGRKEVKGQLAVMANAADKYNEMVAPYAAMKVLLAQAETVINDAAVNGVLMLKPEELAQWRTQLEQVLRPPAKPASTTTPEAAPEMSEEPREWAVHVLGIGHLGSVIENNHANARLAALSKYRVLGERGKSVERSIYSDDDFYVRQV